MGGSSIPAPSQTAVVTAWRQNPAIRGARSSVPAAVYSREMNRADQRRDKWVRLLERSRGELTQMYTFRYVYRQVAEIIKENGKLPASEFFALIQTGYSHSQALAVRRQVDAGDDAETLGRVLHEMCKHPHDATAAGLDIEAVRADAERLKSGTENVRAHVDRLLAHSDRRPLAKLATFKDVHDAIDVVGETYQRTGTALTGELWELETVLDYDWQGVFTVPWLVRPKEWARS